MDEDQIIIFLCVGGSVLCCIVLYIVGKYMDSRRM